MRALSRRTFLAAGGGLLLAAACGGSNGGGNDDEQGRERNAGEFGGLVLSSDVFASEAPQRFAFALARGRQYASGPPVQLAYGPQRGERATVGDFTPTVLHDRGLEAGRGIYTLEVVTPTAGPYVAIAGVEGQEVPFAFQVQEQAAAPVVGQPAPRDPSPTNAAPLDTDPICTRNPPCPLHEVSLDTALGSGKPVAVMFATPARCTSRYCGPVLDDLLTLTDAHQDRVTFVHVEIYQNLRTARFVPTVDAWQLPGEPWLFGVDAAGTIAARLDGAFGTDEQEQVLQQLAG
jgi:hypothetical protein